MAYPQVTILGHDTCVCALILDGPNIATYNRSVVTVYLPTFSSKNFAINDSASLVSGN
jgi:hypothetical protein